MIEALETVETDRDSQKELVEETYLVPLRVSLLLFSPLRAMAYNSCAETQRKPSKVFRNGRTDNRPGGTFVSQLRH